MKYAAVLSVVAVIIIFFTYNVVFAPPTDHEAVTQSNDSVAVEDNVELQKTEKLTGRGSLASLKDFTNPVECTVTYIPEGVEQEVTGTYFVSDGSIRGDFLVQSPDLEGEIVSSVIIDGDDFFGWSEIEGKSYGVKMSVADMGSDEFEKNEPVSFEADVDYSCKDWEVVDNSIFVPPSDILFQDINNMIPPGMEYGTVYDEVPQMR